MTVPGHAYLCEVRARFDGVALDACMDLSQLIGHTPDTYTDFAKACRALGGDVTDVDYAVSHLVFLDIRQRMNPDMRVVLLRSEDPLTLDNIQSLLDFWVEEGVINQRLREHAWYR